MDSSKLLIERMNELPEQLDGLNTSIETNVSQLNDRINNTAQNLTERIDTTTNDLNALITALTQRVATLEARRYVKEAGKSGNQWYRVWSDGFIEQGGAFPGMSGWVRQVITFLKPFTNTNYVVTVCGISYTSSYHAIGCLQAKTTTQFAHYFYSNNSLAPSWYCCGF